MRTALICDLILAQAGYFGFFLISVCIDQGGFKYNHGLSFYGEHLRTLLPYAVGTVMCCWFLFRASTDLDGPAEQPFRKIRISLRALAVLLLLLLLTPDTFGAFLNWSHIVVAFVLFTGELALAAWLAIFVCRDSLIRALLAVQLAAGLAAMFSEMHVLAYLSESSLVYQASFSVLLVLAVLRITDGNTKTDCPKAVSAGQRRRSGLSLGVPRRNLLRTSQQGDSGKQDNSAENLSSKR